MLGIGGRADALDELDGDGVPILRGRLGAAKAGPGRRIVTVLAVVAHPAPRDRRSRRAVADQPAARLPDNDANGLAE